MLISPKEAIANQWITHPDCNTFDDWVERKFVNPNAIDFTLDQLFTIEHQNVFEISENNKTMRGGLAHQPSNDGYWILEPKTSYDGLSNMYVNIPDGVCCELIIRSTFSRNGIFLTSGLYDTAFKGHIGFALHNLSGPAKIAPGVRVGQIKFYQSDSHGAYAGGYNHDRGTHWNE